MNLSSQPQPEADRETPSDTPRVKLQDLLQQRREIEIDHSGKIYRLRLTQANKLILTA
jgi:hemin uptake protein HemP